MKKLTPLIIALCTVSLRVLGQEGVDLSPSREVREFRNEAPSHGTHGNAESEIDTKSFKPSFRETSVRDSVAVTRPAPSKKQEKHPTEDVLKFNFLYYIIQRFKFSDIIE